MDVFSKSQILLKTRKNTKNDPKNGVIFWPFFFTFFLPKNAENSKTTKKSQKWLKMTKKTPLKAGLAQNDIFVHKSDTLGFFEKFLWPLFFCEKKQKILGKFNFAKKWFFEPQKLRKNSQILLKRSFFLVQKWGPKWPFFDPPDMWSQKWTRNDQKKGLFF